MSACLRLFVDRLAVDDELLDAGTAGPELAHLSAVYLASPRALVFQNPSSDWRMLALCLPLGSRLSLMRNPIFSQLVRSWGLHIRFLGIDRERLVYDFRALLSDRTLRLLVDMLAHQTAVTPFASVRAGMNSSDHYGSDHTLDLLLSALSDEMLSVLDRRRSDWGRHLDQAHRLEPSSATTLFDHSGRHPDYLASLRQALREGIIDVYLYGRALRAVDLREAAVDARMASLIEESLDPLTLTHLARARMGKHLGCYNWLRLAPKHAPLRAHLLARLPALANFLVSELAPLDAADRIAPHPDALPELFDKPLFNAATPLSPIDCALAKPLDEHHSTTTQLVRQRLRQAVDTGQDRAIIEALAARFEVEAAVVRQLWHEAPRALGEPPAWQIPTLLRMLNERDPRRWPRTEEAWQALLSCAIPEEAR